MSRTNSVLNFREIIINGIQDLESGVKKGSNGRDNSFDKMNNSPPLPYFAADETQQNRELQHSTSHAHSNYTNYNNSSLDNNQLRDRIVLQQFKKPSFNNPVSLSSKCYSQNQNYSPVVKLKALDLSKVNQDVQQNSSQFAINQKENLDFSECTFRENDQKKSIQYFKGINLELNNGQDQLNGRSQYNHNYNQLSNRKQGESGRPTVEMNNSYGTVENNHRLSRPAEQSIQSYLNSRMEAEGDRQQSLFTNNDDRSKGNARNEYFSIYDNPNRDREEIIKTLSLKKEEVFKSGYKSRNDSNPFNHQKKDNNNQLSPHKNNAQQSISRQNSQRKIYSKQQMNCTTTEKNETLSKSPYQQKGIVFSPLKKSSSTISQKNTLERFPSQVSFNESLRSYSPNNKMLNSKPYNYIINKNNLKKMVLFFESDKVRGLYNLTAFIKLFRELGLVQVKASDKFIIQKEIQLIEELWRLLKFSSYSAECVSTCFIYQILIVIIDSKIHKLEQAAPLIDTLCKKEYSKYSNFFDQERENSQIWLSLTIIDGIRNALQFSERNEDIFEVKELQSIRSSTKKTRYDKLFDHTQYLKTDLNEKVFSKEKMNNIKDALSYRFEESIQASKSSENLFENSDFIQESIEKQDRFFKMNDLSEKTIESPQKFDDGLQSYSMEKTDKQIESDEYQKQKNVHERLFQCAYNKIQTRSTHHLLKEEEEQSKLSQCTFKPQINKNTNKILQRSLSSLGIRKNNQDYQISAKDEQPIQDSIKGVKQNLQRMEQARQQKEYKLNFWENQRLKCQNISRSKSPVIRTTEKGEQIELMSRSPSLNVLKQRSNVIKEKPMIYVEINISKGKSGKIAIYQGDQPQQVAQNFAKIYHLNQSAQDKLYRKLQDILQVYYNQLYNKI